MQTVGSISALIPLTLYVLLNMHNSMEWIDLLGLAKVGGVQCPENHTSNPKKKVNSAEIGDTVRIPDTHPKDFDKSKETYKIRIIRKYFA
ncbi:hypothetical protein CRV00_06300 [Malaciobacter molluscorum]|nr:hypothetical protein CRV00_06300 [Malaciobacter molluscorum]